MKNFINEFKQFIMRGNVIDMAVGVVVGTAFSTIVNSLVQDVIMPAVSLITGKIDFTNDKHQNKMIAFLIAGLNDDAVNICSKIDDFELEVLLKNPVYYKNRTYLDYLEICHEALVDRYGVTTNSLEIEREVQRQKQINVKTQHKYPCSKEDEFLLWLYETVGLPQLVELLGIEDVLIERIKKEKNHLFFQHCAIGQSSIREAFSNAEPLDS